LIELIDPPFLEISLLRGETCILPCSGHGIDEINQKMDFGSE
jgi:hypothetical protein